MCSTPLAGHTAPAIGFAIDATRVSAMRASARLGPGAGSGTSGAAAGESTGLVAAVIDTTVVVVDVDVVVVVELVVVVGVDVDDDPDVARLVVVVVDADVRTWSSPRRATATAAAPITTTAIPMASARRRDVIAAAQYWNKLKLSPSGPAQVAIRPTSGTSNGGASTMPPSFSTLATAASTSPVPK